MHIQKEYGEAPNMFSALTYDATNLGLQALEKAGKTGADLQKRQSQMLNLKV